MKPTPSTASPQPFAADLDYLQAELGWIEARCARIATSHEGIRPEPDVRKPRRGSAAEGEQSILPRLLQIEQGLRSDIDARLVQNRSVGPSLALDRICDLHQLDPFERTVILLAAAPVFSRATERWFGSLDGEFGSRASLTVEVVCAFGEMAMGERIRRRSTFSPSGKLASNDLVTIEVGTRMSAPEDLLGAAVHLSARVFSHLVGDATLLGDFSEFSSLQEPMASLEQVVLPQQDKARVLSVLNDHERYLRIRSLWGIDDVVQYGKGTILLFHGAPGTGKTLFAHAIARHLSKKVLSVDVPTLSGCREADHFLPALFREARLQGALLFFDECEGLFADRRSGNGLLSILLTELERFEGTAILATNLPEMLDPALKRRILVRVAFTLPDREARAAIWQRHLPPATPLAPDVDLRALADRFAMAGGYIKNSVLCAIGAAVHEGGDTPVLHMGHLEAAAADQLQTPLSEERRLVRPGLTLDDVVVASATMDALRGVVAAARNLGSALHVAGVGDRIVGGRAIGVVVTGEAGTGKSVVAEAIAGELRRPLLCVSIPVVVSSIVGQTARAVGGALAEAAEHGAVLLLDAADSLLMVPAEQNPHETTASRALLHLLARHEGVVVMTSRTAKKLNPEMIGAMHAVVHLVTPGVEERAAMWVRFAPEGLLTFEQADELAGTNLNGRQIRDCVIRAVWAGSQRGSVLSLDELLHEAGVEARKNPVQGPMGFGSSPTNGHHPTR